jgi:uncharacterized protein (TIGR02596 family)
MEPIKPKKLRRPSFQRGRRGGFSLIELLAVLVIMAILSAAAIPQLESVLQASAITQGGQSVAEAINSARQMASARNVNVEIRLVNLANNVVNPSSPTDPSATGYNAVQLWGTPSGRASEIPLDRLTILPASVVVSQDETHYSPLLNATGNIVGSGSKTMVIGTASYAYVSFYINPSGMVPLSSTITTSSQQVNMPTLYLSIVPANFGSTTTAPPAAGTPKDYLIVQINPDTGSTLIYRP